MEDKRQKIIADFYKEFLSYRPESLGANIGVGVTLNIFYGIYMWMPLCYHTDIRIDLVCFILGFLGPCFYTAMYRNYRELGKSYSIMERLRYLPVSKDEIRRFQVSKLFRFTKISGIVFAVGQLALSFLIAKHVGWQELAFAIGMGFVAPFVSNWLLLRE